MIIEVHDSQDAEPAFLGEVLTRLAQHQHVGVASIYVTPREVRPFRSNPIGWIEYLMVINYVGGGKLTVGALQRNIGEPTEFHS